MVPDPGPNYSGSDVNKDGTHKENDKDQVFKDKDKNKHLTYDL